MAGIATDPEQVHVAVIGAGPAGLAAADVLAEQGLAPVIFEAMPSPARKFLMAGKSGLNLTKEEPAARFQDKVGCPNLLPILDDFGPNQVMAWAEGLGEKLFTGSSRRVFPVAMKASPLLRKWLARLGAQRAELRTRWRWCGWEDDCLAFQTIDGMRHVRANAVVLALGGASWPRLGSDGAWAAILGDRAVAVTPLYPSNVGFNVPWSDHFRERFEGVPVKNICLRVGEGSARGDLMVTGYGLEGGPLYEVSTALRTSLEDGQTSLFMDLLPDVPNPHVFEKISRPRGKTSLSNHLRKTLGLKGVKAALLREAGRALPDNAKDMAMLIKALPIAITGPRPIEEAISTAGGVAWESLDKSLMLKAVPGVFVAGEMLDWDAPTGGYLLTTCLATGRHAGQGAARFLVRQK